MPHLPAMCSGARNYRSAFICPLGAGTDLGATVKTCPLPSFTGGCRPKRVCPHKKPQPDARTLTWICSAAAGPQGKEVLCLTLSSGLSSIPQRCYGRSMLAEQDKVAVVDTLAASGGQGMLVLVGR